MLLGVEKLGIIFQSRNALFALVPAVNVNRVINDLTDAHNRQTARISTVSGSEAITNAQYTQVRQPAASITISNERG